MVAIINTSNSLSETVQYNERKVKLGLADCFFAANYPKDIECLTAYDKLRRLTHQAALNERVKRNSVHITLNFHDDDKLNKQKLQSITEEYMQKIGFGDQPFLVYEHHDAGQQHLHIVSTNIQRDGSRIYMQCIGRNQSQKAKKELEIKYKLVRAEGRKKEQEKHFLSEKITAQKVIYGKSQTLKAISQVLHRVLQYYTFTSLFELNSVLRLYNVAADRGNVNSFMYRKRGLVYQVLDKNGKKTGMPIRAADIYNKPVLGELEKIFLKNVALKQQMSKTLKTEIDWIVFKNQELNLHSFHAALRENNIQVMVSQNDQGLIHGLTYIDHKKGLVITGSELGKEYGAKAILEKCGLHQNLSRINKMNVHPDSISSVKEKSSKESLSKKLPQHWQITIDELLKSSLYKDLILPLPDEKKIEGLRQSQRLR